MANKIINLKTLKNGLRFDFDYMRLFYGALIDGKTYRWGDDVFRYNRKTDDITYIGVYGSVPCDVDNKNFDKDAQNTMFNNWKNSKYDNFVVRLLSPSSFSDLDFIVKYADGISIIMPETYNNDILSSAGSSASVVDEAKPKENQNLIGWNEFIAEQSKQTASENDIKVIIKLLAELFVSIIGIKLLFKIIKK